MNGWLQRKTRFRFLVITCVTILLGCQPSAESRPQVRGLASSNIVTLEEGSLRDRMGAHLELEPVFLDLNERTNWTIKGEFRVHNLLPTEIELLVKGSSCGCATVEVDRLQLQTQEMSTVALVVNFPYRQVKKTEAAYLEVMSAGTPICNRLQFSLTCPIFPRIISGNNRSKQAMLVDRHEPTNRSIDVITYQPIDESTCDTVCQFNSPLFSARMVDVHRWTKTNHRRTLTTFEVKCEGIGDTLTPFDVKATFQCGEFRFPIELNVQTVDAFWCQPRNLFLNLNSDQTRTPFSIWSHSELKDLQFETPYDENCTVEATSEVLASGDEFVQKYILVFETDQSTKNVHGFDLKVTSISEGHSIVVPVRVFGGQN